MFFQISSAWNDKRVNLIMLRKDYGDNALNLEDKFWVPSYKLTTAFVESLLEYEKGELSIPFFYGIRVNKVPPSVLDSKEGNLKSGHFAFLNVRLYERYSMLKELYSV